MNQQKPLSYLCLKSVIQYMDFHFRHISSCQITSLRNILKVVPLRLGFLELNNSALTFDNIEYLFTHRREFIERDGDDVTELYSQYDLNNDGNEEIFHDLMPGDIVIKDRDWRGGFPYIDSTFISDSYILCRVRTSLSNPYQYRKSSDGIRIRDMMRRTLNKVLGGKRIHQVEHLKIGVYHGVLRLPEGLKLKIRELSIRENKMAVIDAILPILDASSFPLNSLSVRVSSPQDPVFQSEILKTSEFLNIENRDCFDNDWANLLINLPNMKIHLTNKIPSNDIFLLIRNWLERPRVIGTRLSMQTAWVKCDINEFEEEFKDKGGVLHARRPPVPFPRFTLPMTSTSELNVYGAKSPNHEEELKTGSGKDCMIVIEIMPIGTVKPSKDQ